MSFSVVAVAVLSQERTEWIGIIQEYGMNI